jgi:hypothetical protein
MNEFSDTRTEQPQADAIAGEFVTETFDYDDGRQVTVYVPPVPPEAIVFAGDGQMISQWGKFLEAADVPSTMIVGVHRVADETLRLHEYSPKFDPERFAAHDFRSPAAQKAGEIIQVECGAMSAFGNRRGVA